MPETSVRTWLGVLFLASPALLILTGIGVIGGLLVGPTGHPVAVGAACLCPLSTALSGLASVLAVYQARRDTHGPRQLQSFWVGAIVASAGLCTGPWWLFSGRFATQRPTTPRPQNPAAQEPSLAAMLPFSPLPLLKRDTERHAGLVPLARRRPTRLERVTSPLQPLQSGTLAPTVQIRRRAKRPRDLE